LNNKKAKLIITLVLFATIGTIFLIKEIGIGTKAATPGAVVDKIISSTGYKTYVTLSGTKITYNSGTWNNLDVLVSNHCAENQDKMEIIIRPEVDMNLGIRLNGDGTYLRNSWKFEGVFTSNYRQVLTFDINEDVKFIRFYCDPKTRYTSLEGKHSFEIESIRFYSSSVNGVVAKN
jgi:hypothetical protein